MRLPVFRFGVVVRVVPTGVETGSSASCCPRPGEMLSEEMGEPEQMSEQLPAPLVEVLSVEEDQDASVRAGLQVHA